MTNYSRLIFKAQKARKPHVCDRCGATIAIDEDYVICNVLFGNEKLFHQSAHEKCLTSIERSLIFRRNDPTCGNCDHADLRFNQFQCPKYHECMSDSWKYWTTRTTETKKKRQEVELRDGYDDLEWNLGPSPLRAKRPKITPNPDHVKETSQP